MNAKLVSAALVWLRVLMGCGIAYHGYGKIFGGRMDGFTEAVTSLGFPLPAFFAWAAALSEFGGGILIAIGLFTRLAALMVFVTMFVAAFIQHGGDPFSKKELALAYWTMAGTLVAAGGGPCSVDGWIASRREDGSKPKARTILQ